MKRRLLSFVLMVCLLLGCVGPLGRAESADLEPIEFSIFHPDANRRIPPDDAVIVNQVFEKTGVHLRWQVPPADAVERLNIMLATDDLPDLIYFDDMTMMNHFIEAGKLLDLETLWQEHAPESYKNTDHFHDRIRAEDGKMYFLPSYYSFGDKADSRYFPEAEVGFVMRSGLLEELDWYNPSTFDKVLELLRESKERYPDMAPLALALGPQGYLDEIKMIGAGAFGLTYDYNFNNYFDMILQKEELKYFTDVPEMKQWYAFLNTIHREGLLDIESPVMSKDMLKSKVVAGKAFSFMGYMWEIVEEFNALEASNGGHERLVNDLFPGASESVTKLTYAPYTEHLYTAGIAITTKCKDPERYMKFFEYLNTEEGWYASHGVLNEEFTGENTFERTEGYDYVVRNDREPIRAGLKIVEASAWLGEMWGADENWWWNVRGEENFREFKYEEGNHPNGKYDYVSDLDVGMWWDEDETRIRNAYGVTGLNFWEKQTELGCDITNIAGLVVAPESDAEIALLTMKEYLNTQIPRIIMADSEEEFETLWSEMDEKLVASGKETYVKAKQELYEQRLKDWELK